MKILSLSYTPDAEDYVSYLKKAEPALFVMRVKRMLIPFVLMAAGGLMFGIYISVVALALLILSCLTPTLLSKEYIKGYKSSRLVKRPVKLDFYEDHIEQLFLPDESFRGTNEKHYDIRSFGGVIESEEYIYLIAKNGNMLVIPKKVLEGDQYCSLTGLLHRHFSGRYQKI